MISAPDWSVCTNIDEAREMSRTAPASHPIVMPASLVMWMVERIDRAQQVYRLKRWGRASMFMAGVFTGNAVCIAIVWWQVSR